MICAKNHPVPPISNSALSPNGAQSFGTKLSGARSAAVYELKDFANSIILYKLNGTPGNDKIITNITNDSELVSAVKGEPNKELKTSNAGYEIKLWLENGYNSGAMSENDFNIVTLHSFITVAQGFACLMVMAFICGNTSRACIILTILPYIFR